MFTWTFGKEYELSTSLQFPEGDAKHTDASGPSEIVCPPVSMDRVHEALYTEYLLRRTYGLSLYEYYHGGTHGTEQKGSHFHVATRSNRYINPLWIALNALVVTPLVKVLIHGNSFRDSVGYWAQWPQARRTYDRAYLAVTYNPADSRKPWTYEVRIAEYSVVGDLVFTAVAASLAYHYTNVTENDLDDVLYAMQNRYALDFRNALLEVMASKDYYATKALYNVSYARNLLSLAIDTHERHPQIQWLLKQYYDSWIINRQSRSFTAEWLLNNVQEMMSAPVKNRVRKQVLDMLTEG